MKLDLGAKSFCDAFVQVFITPGPCIDEETRGRRIQAHKSYDAYSGIILVQDCQNEKKHRDDSAHFGRYFDGT